MWYFICYKSKKQNIAKAFDENEDLVEDEAPQIVQLKNDDLSEQEYKLLKSKKDIEGTYTLWLKQDY